MHPAVRRARRRLGRAESSAGDRVARAGGVRRFTATMLADNVAAHRLLHRLAGRLAHERHLGLVDEVDIPLAA
jgi:hypothetical protein